MKNFLFIFLLIAWQEMPAQLMQTDRYEITLRNHDDQFEVLMAGDRGMYLHRQVVVSRKPKLHIVRLDTALQERWSGYIDIPKNYIRIGFTFHDDKMYLLQRHKDLRQNELLLYAIDEKDGNYLQYKVRGYIPFMPTEYKVTASAMLAAGYYNKIPVILYFSFLTNKSRVLPGIFNEEGEINHIQVNDDNSFDVLINGMNNEKQRVVWIRNYDVEGNLLATSSIKPDNNYNLLFGRLIKTQDGNQLVAGVYGTRSTEYSRGIFISSISPEINATRYYPYADLENFFKYMTARREERVKNRIERRKVKGKKIRLSYRFLVHEIVPYNDQFILLGEAFYPKYTQLDRARMIFFAPPRNGIVQDGRIFEGYHYTHAVVMGFKPNGDLLWDNSFEINDVKSFKLEQFVKLKLFQDKIALLYVFDNKVRTKIIHDNQVIEGKSEESLRTLFSGEVVSSSSQDVSKLEYGVSNDFYAHGVQEIRTPTGRFNRRVFYVNRIKHLAAQNP